MRYTWMLVGAFIVVLGCATTSSDRFPPAQDTLPPPIKATTGADLRSDDYFLLKMADSTAKANVHWWVEFRRAQLWQDLDPALACAKYTILGQETKFPLYKLAR